MAFRTIVVRDQCKLEYSLNYLVCRKGNEEKRVLLNEVKLIVIDSVMVSISSFLISEIINKKIKIIFTDDKHNPVGEITPYYNNFYSYRKIKEQISFSQEVKDYLWSEIIKEKINNQANNLKLVGKLQEYSRLLEYKNDVKSGDFSNREGHSAKVYFNTLFGNDFSRDQNNDINKYLNYGYSILMSTISREIRTYGYLTELGIHHIGESNSFNLSCDLIEPFRPLIDSYVILNKVDNDNYKDEFIKILSKEVLYNGKSIFLDNAIHLYVEDLLSYLQTGNLEKIRFVKYEL